ncbi:hypothetical protein ACHAXR_010720 [Thalassiosira sp. AJA248-18]
MMVNRSLIAVLLSATLLQFCNAFSVTTSSVAELIRLLPDHSANDVLRNVLRADEETTQQSPVRLDGLVTKRRAIGKHLIFIDVVPLDLPEIPAPKSKTNKSYEAVELMTPVQAIMRSDVWNDVVGDGTNNSTPSSYEIYHKIIQPGVHVQLTGHAGPSRNSNEAIVFCQSAKYTLANDNPQHLRNVLRYVKEGVLDMNEVLDALPCISHEEFTNIMGLGNQTSPTNSFGEMAVELLSKFPRNYLCNPSQLMGSTNSQKVKLLPPAPPEYVNAPSICLDKDDAAAGEEEAEEEDVVSIAICQLIWVMSRTAEKEQKRMDSNTYKQFTITGWVQNRRRYQGSISVLELVDEFTSLALLDNHEEETASPMDTTSENSKLRDLWNKRIYSILHPEAMSSVEASEMYANIAGPGARVMLHGYLQANSSDDVATFWVSNCRLLRSSWRPSAVRQVLDLLHDGKFEVDEAADSLKLSGGYSQAEDIANGDTSATERQWMAAEITQSLQGENTRIGKISSSMEKSLDSFAFARDRYPIEKIESTELAPTRGIVTSLLQSNESPLRTSREGSRWQRAKKPQLKFMIQQISTVLRSHPEFGQRKLKVVDIGGGKGLLSNLLAETFGDDTVEVQVVDISRSATNNGMMRAKRRGLKNIQYNALDATQLDVTGVDVVVALHACGVLTDVALGHAVCQGAGFVVCPCCFRSNPHLRVSVPANKDGDREFVTAEEWLQVDSDPALYGQLKQLAELQGDIKMASTAMHTICGLRASSVDKLWHNTRLPAAELGISIKTFPIGFSTRNFCLVGTFIDT